jgi:hypothetical protein
MPEVADIVGGRRAMSFDTVQMNRFTLAFDDAALEREFLDEYADSTRLQMRGVCLVVGAMLLAFAAIDPPGPIGFYTGVLRYSVAGPTLLPALALTFAPAKLFRRFWAVLYAAFAALNLAVVPALLVLIPLRVPSWHIMDDLWTFSALGARGVVFVVILTGVATFAGAFGNYRTEQFRRLFSSSEPSPRSARGRSRSYAMSCQPRSPSDSSSTPRTSPTASPR